jgi:hypothetical protein
MNISERAAYIVSQSSSNSHTSTHHTVYVVVGTSSLGRTFATYDAAVGWCGKNGYVIRPDLAMLRFLRTPKLSSR